jgi:DNA-binding transcriptional LysR family regulator
VSLTSDLIAWAERLRGAAIGSVRVGMIDVAALFHFPDVLARFRADRPDVDLHLTVAPSRGLLDALRIGDLDVVVCVDPGQLPPGIVATPVLDERLVVYAPLGTVIGAAANWGPWVLFPTDSFSRALIEDALRARSVPITIAAESHQPDVLRQMVDLGLGWTVLPAVQGPDDRTAVAGPELLTRRVVVAHRDAAVTDPAVEELRSRLLAT